MARITVEDCLKKIDSQYDLVLLAKERTTQLNAGEAMLVPKDNDKNTVVALREIGEGKVTIKSLEDAAINRLRKVHETAADVEELEEDQDDDFDKIYKGEVSKSGTAILPSKRVRRMVEKSIINTKDSEDDVENIEEIEDKDIKKDKNTAETESVVDEDKSE